MTSKVALLVPCFNSFQTIGATLDSIQAQENGLAEIAGLYLADDASTDVTLSAAQWSWKCKIPLQILTNSTNKGERSNINRAIREIGPVADWILILHSDDLARRDWLSCMLKQIEACTDDVASICSSWSTLTTNGTMELGEDNPSRAVEVIKGTKESARNTVLRGCWWHISGCAIRVRAFREIGEFRPDLPQLGDWEWLLRLLRSGWSVEYIPRTLIVYRLHEQSVSANSFRTDRDVREKLLIIRENRDLLTLLDVLRLQGRLTYSVVRRMGRSIISGNFTRLVQNVQTIMLVEKSLLRCYL